MNDEDPDRDDPAARVAELTRAKNDAIARGLDRTASRIALEIKRAAKSAHQLSHYAWALHTLTNGSASLIDHEAGREAAVELIALLESEERARQIEPDLDIAEYEDLVRQLSSCAYDNLAKTTAASQGYNSDGLHDAIAEGIQVCRRTGKLECIACFREYAADVFRASDDLPMALHHARSVAAADGDGPGAGRRWSGTHSEVELLLIQGSIGEAEKVARRAWELCDTFHDPHGARLTTVNLLRTALLLMGADDSLSDLDGFKTMSGSAPSADESPQHQLRVDLVSSLRSLTGGDHATAIDTLTSWDRRLQDRRSLDSWFEVRLRLIAAYRLAGDEKRAEALARQLKAKASEARDWLTLRRLARLFDPSVPVSPIAPSGPIIIGPMAPQFDGAIEAEPKPPGAGGDSTRLEEPPATPLAARLDELETQLGANAEDPATRSLLLDSLLELGHDMAVDPVSVSRMLELAGVLCDDPAHGQRIWDWAEAIAMPLASAASVLSRLAFLGDALRNADNSQVTAHIDEKRIEQLFRRSLDLDPNDASNFERAAIHHLNAGRTNEAERCLARCLRLDRANPRAALWLAEIYSRSDRSNDALAVVDMTLRAGSDSPDVAWRAVLLANSLSQNEATLTYLDQFERARPGRAVVNYYRASALLWLGRPAEAMTALDEEVARNEGTWLNILILRACAMSALGRLDDLRAQLTEVLAMRWFEVNYITPGGFVQLSERLWNAARVLPADDPVVASLVDRLLVTGLAPNALFEPDRSSKAPTEGLNYYVCTILQPLDDRWQDYRGRLSDQEQWTAYRVSWGVLAADEVEARSTTLAWQARCYPLEPSVEQVVLEGEGYTDHPGIVWQGMRSAPE